MTTFLVIHQSAAEQIIVEYGDREGAEDSARFLTRTQGGATKVYAATVIGEYFQHRDLQVEIERLDDAREYLSAAAQDDTHSSDVEPRS